jgi:hypothetical protein
MIPSDTKLKAFATSSLENNPIEVKVQGAPNVMDYYFTSTLGCNSKLMWGKMCYEDITKLKA